MKHLPNALTLLRLVLAPVVVWLFWMGAVSPGELPPVVTGPGDVSAAKAFTQYLKTIAFNLTLAAIFFAVAALTDLFDGMAARAFNAHSKFGRLIDPIADKAIVGLPLIVISIAMWRSGYPLWPVVAVATAVIVLRDVSMTLIRLTSPDGEGARVSSLAKIKTALELIVVGSLLGVSAIGAHLQVQYSIDNPGYVLIPFYALGFEWGWLITLVVTAALSAWTAFQYLRPAKPAR
jgi:CDP-diacylglycerol--glycerol-3-phosphate 3-phosphatidyltransferase